eukprot:scaffold60724_cov71-Phaeocystis_antarctica.AAC.3
MRASALFLSSGELSQASTANSKSCAYERLARRDNRLMRRPRVVPERSGSAAVLRGELRHHGAVLRGTSPSRRGTHTRRIFY